MRAEAPSALYGPSEAPWVGEARGGPQAEGTAAAARRRVMRVSGGGCE
jgi:hypothetical protein